MLFPVLRGTPSAHAHGQERECKYPHRAVDSQGDTVDFLLTARQDKAAVCRFPRRAINLHDVRRKVAIDMSDATRAAIESVQADACVDILMRQNKYLNNIVEQDHRAIKQVLQSSADLYVTPTKATRAKSTVTYGHATSLYVRGGQ